MRNALSPTPRLIVSAVARAMISARLAPASTLIVSKKVSLLGAKPSLRRFAKKARLIDVLEDAGVKTVKYLYDFGDGWEHTVKVERVTDAVPGLTYPRLVDAVGRCPPEDVGGSWGYDEFLDALADPAHENHAEMKDWIGEEFDPAAVDVEALANDVAALAKAWTRKRIHPASSAWRV